MPTISFFYNIGILAVASARPLGKLTQSPPSPCANSPIPLPHLLHMKGDATLTLSGPFTPPPASPLPDPVKPLVQLMFC